MFKVLTGDCLDVMAGLPDNSVDSIVTDPPYGISFMGKAWDKSVPSVDVWKQALRVLKPGGHVLCFAGTRTQHRMACALEDAGFEIRDLVGWMYGSGFPKSHDISKAIDKAAGEEREVLGINSNSRENCSKANTLYESGTVGKLAYHTAPATDAAKTWDGWGSALKPAFEPITLARKPIKKGNTLASNVIEFGTGGLNIDGCRVPAEKATGWGGGGSKLYEGGLSREGGEARLTDAGRWPANFIHDGSDEVLDIFPEGAARFFYCAKASKKDRDDGLDGFAVKRTGAMRATADGCMLTGSGNERTTARANIHPTVKPTSLMEYLCRLITPPGGTVLDPFCGSGSTGRGAVLNGFDFIGIELDGHHVEISEARIKAALDRHCSPG